MKKEVSIIKIGGQIFEQEADLNAFVSSIGKINGPLIIVHGAGTIASKMSKQLGIESPMVDGRRITSNENMEILAMVFSGLNKKLVAKLMGANKQALGLSGADFKLLPANFRKHPSIDFGYVGDIIQEEVNGSVLEKLLAMECIPVISSMTCTKDGELLNTNADSIALSLALYFSKNWVVNLRYCFGFEGILKDIKKPEDYFQNLNEKEVQNLIDNGVISGGMLPKINNALVAAKSGIKVNIGSFNQLSKGTSIVT